MTWEHGMMRSPSISPCDNKCFHTRNPKPQHPHIPPLTTYSPHISPTFSHLVIGAKFEVTIVLNFHRTLQKFTLLTLTVDSTSTSSTRYLYHESRSTELNMLKKIIKKFTALFNFHIIRTSDNCLSSIIQLKHSSHFVH